MATTMRVPTIFTAVDKFSGIVNGMTKSTRGFSAGMNRLDNKMNNVFNSLAVGALFYSVGNEIREYEKKLASLGAVTGTTVGSMNKQIESLGKESTRSVIDIAGAFEIVGSKMSEYLKEPEALKKITKASILMAEAARMELEPAIESLTGVMNIYKMTAEDAYKVVNKLSAGETVGSVSISQTADILTQFGAQAVRANVPIEESIALIQTLTKSLGVEGVGRGLRNVLFDISSTKTWDKNRWKAIKMAGVDFEFVTNNANNLVDRLRELKKLSSVKGAMELFFKRTGTVAANTLFQNFDKNGFTDFLDKIKALNDAEEKAAKNNATLDRLVKRLKDTFTNFIVTDNQANGVLSVTKNIMGWMINNMGFLINLIGSVAIAFMAWKTIVGVISLVSGIMSAFTAIMGVHRFIVLWSTMANIGYAESMLAVAAATWLTYWPILLIIAALGLLVYAFWDSSRSMDSMISSQTSSMIQGSTATENMINSQIYSLEKGNVAFRNSTKVKQDELTKQRKIMESVNPKINLSSKSNSAIQSLSLIQNKMSAANIQNSKLPKSQMLSTEALKYQVQQGDYDFEDVRFKKQENRPFINPNREMKSISKDFMGNGTLNVNLNAPPGVINNVDDTNAKGVKVNVGSTIGQFGQ